MLLCAALLTACTKAPASGWYCEEISYNKYTENLQKTDLDQAHRELDPLKSKPLGLTDDMLLTGFFNQDVYITEEDAGDLSDDRLKNMHFADAEYGDMWYYTLHEPEKYLTLTDYLMPDYIRIAYAPKGSIITGTEESIIISLPYTDEKDELTEAFAFIWHPVQIARSAISSAGFHPTGFHSSFK